MTNHEASDSGREQELIDEIRRLSEEMTTARARERADLRRSLVVELVNRCGGSQTQAARRLGWSTSRLGSIARGERGIGRRRRRDDESAAGG